MGNRGQCSGAGSKPGPAFVSPARAASPPTVQVPLGGEAAPRLKILGVVGQLRVGPRAAPQEGQVSEVAGSRVPQTAGQPR